MRDGQHCHQRAVVFCTGVYYFAGFGADVFQFFGHHHAAAEKFVTNDFKSAFAALKKYVNLQNQMIYKLADIYEKEKSVSYEIFTGMLHTTHQDMSTQEVEYINFLSGVDYYADKEK